MHKINFLSLLANAILFITISFALPAFSQSPAVFNPKANEYKDKLVIAKTFATWCRYCRQNAVRETELRETYFPKIEDSSSQTTQIVNLVLVPLNDYEESVNFFAEIGVETNIRIMSRQQAEDWNLNNLGSTVIFHNNQFIKLLEAEVDLVTTAAN